MKVLVTGSHGYIGSIIVPLLERAGHDVVGLDSLYYRGCDFGAAGPAPAPPADVRDVRPTDLDGFDAVLHYAALSNDPLGDLNPEWTYDLNLHALEAKQRQGAFEISISYLGHYDNEKILCPKF